MKKLSVPKPTILLMMGVPGAGKSFFARQFADNYGLPRVSTDRIRFELFNEPSYTSAEQQIVHRLAEHMTDELLRSGSSFIVDGLLGNTKTSRLNLARRAREHDYKLMIIWVQVDQATAKGRSLKRKAGKRDDQYNKALPEAIFAAWCKQLTPIMNEHHVVVSGKHAYPTQESAVLRKVEQPLEATHQAEAGNNTAAAPDENPVKKPMKVVTPTPTRHMGKPADRANRRIIIS